MLIDPELRAVYDETGERGLKGRDINRRGAAKEVWETWAEFKPFKRKSVFKHFSDFPFARISYRNLFLSLLVLDKSSALL